jgi:hypothetical protein
VELLDQIEVVREDGLRRIQLLHGDLSNIPPEHSVDVLVISAFPNGYAPTRSSLIGALSRRGLSVARLAEKKEWDLREDFSCWMSCHLHEAGIFNFKRLLCFETADRGQPYELVSDIFHALSPFVFAEPRIRSVAMPVLATGNQGHDFKTMLRALLAAGQHALSEGTPLDVIKIVVNDERQLGAARRVFSREQRSLRAVREAGHPESDQTIQKSERVLGNSAAAETVGFDVFISYARADHLVATSLADNLRNAGLSVFIDTSAINHGEAWLERIHDALDSCRSVIAVYSPDFVQSRPCKWEFNLACAKNLESDGTFLHPILVRDAQLPIYMRALNYRDCRVSDLNKVRVVAEALARGLSMR